MKYSLHPGAENDLREAARFYKERVGTELVLSLFTEFESAVNLLIDNPLVGAEWRAGKRRYILKRFPFSLIYTFEEDEIRIWAVAHHKRKPGYWKNRK